MNELSIFLKLKIILQRLFARFYFQFNHAKLPFSEKCKLKKLKDYIFTGNDLLPSSSGIIIYAATIGELRAASQFIIQVQQKFPECLLVLVPSQTQYTEVYANIYPFAVIIKEFPSHPSVVDQFFSNVRAKFCIFIEGPSLHGFFPIRQDLSLAIGCLRHSVPLFIVNACLYENNGIGSRFDLIEHKFFSGLLQEAIKYWFVPNEEIEQDFIEHNISKQKLIVTGDIKLDNVFTEALPPTPNDLFELFDFYKKNNCRLIVAGSVNEYDEQVALIKAWVKIQPNFPNVVLIIVPRYINNQVMMGKLYQFLADLNIAYARRSQGLKELRPDQVLIVDVFGELPYFYKYAEIAFAGRGHGVLEPMKFLKPVVIGPRETWEKVGSTAYHLFGHFLNKKALIECTDYEKLNDCFTSILKNPKYGDAYIQRYSQVIREQMGASERIVSHICKALPKQHQP